MDFLKGIIDIIPTIISLQPTRSMIILSILVTAYLWCKIHKIRREEKKEDRKEEKEEQKEEEREKILNNIDRNLNDVKTNTIQILDKLDEGCEEK